MSALSSPAILPAIAARSDQSMPSLSPRANIRAAAALVASPESSAAPGRNICPPRGTKRSLFGGAHGSKKSAKTPTTDEVAGAPPAVDGSTADLEPANTVKDDQVPPAKKRTSGGKGSGKGSTPK